VLALEPRYTELDIGAVPASEGSPEAFEVRAFFPKQVRSSRIREGSLNASLAEWLLAHGAGDGAVRPPGHGARARRRVHVSQDADGTIWSARTSRASRARWRSSQPCNPGQRRYTACGTRGPRR